MLFRKANRLFLFFIPVFVNISDDAKSPVKKKEYGKDYPDFFRKISKLWIEKEICTKKEKHGGNCDAEYPGEFLHDDFIFSPSNRVVRYRLATGSSMPV